MSVNRVAGDVPARMRNHQDSFHAFFRAISRDVLS
jgi:hypothetical protein